MSDQSKSALGVTICVVVVVICGLIYELKELEIQAKCIEAKGTWSRDSGCLVR